STKNARRRLSFVYVNYVNIFFVWPSCLRVFVVAFPAVVAGCLLAARSWSVGAAANTQPWPVTLVDVADRAGLREPTVYGGVDRKRFIIETNGAGVAFLDYDNDGWIDALVLNGTRLKANAREAETYAEGQAPLSRLYRNNRDGTFSDVTSSAGLTAVGWASSVCAGDYDNV